MEPEEAGDGEILVHKACGFPVYADSQGNWHHVETADDVFCALLFSGGSLLDKLLEED